MNDELRKEIIQYRIESAEALLTEIDSHINNGFYNTAVNRMYYACFYSVSALLLYHRIDGVKTHEGVRQMFGKHFNIPPTCQTRSNPARDSYLWHAEGK